MGSRLRTMGCAAGGGHARGGRALWPSPRLVPCVAGPTPGYRAPAHARPPSGRGADGMGGHPLAPGAGHRWGKWLEAVSAAAAKALADPL